MNKPSWYWQLWAIKMGLKCLQGPFNAATYHTWAPFVFSGWGHVILFRGSGWVRPKSLPNRHGKRKMNKGTSWTSCSQATLMKLNTKKGNLERKWSTVVGCRVFSLGQKICFVKFSQSLWVSKMSVNFYSNEKSPSFASSTTQSHHLFWLSAKVQHPSSV